MIRLNNETLLIEPSAETESQHMLHIVYPPQSSVLRHISLADDQAYHQPARRARRSVDYDDYGNEITNTVNTPQESVDFFFPASLLILWSVLALIDSVCSYSDDDDWGQEEEEDNSIDNDEDALISDR